MFNPKKIRQDFPILRRRIYGKPLAYLDNGATSQKPKQVINSLVDFYQNHNANVHRGIHILSDEATTLYEKARKQTADFINGKPEEIIFTRNTTEAINLIAWTWGAANIKKGDLVLSTEMEHHSNIVPWQQLVKNKGAVLEFIKIDSKTFQLDLNDLKQKLKKKPKLVCITHLSNVLGTINPIKEIIRLACKVDAKTLIDGAQGLPHLPVNVKDFNCDFYAFSGHKMLGPMGIGGVYVRHDILQAMKPFLTGGGMIAEVYKEKSVFASLPDRFDAGTPNVAGAVGLAAAIDYLQKIGMENIRKHEKELTRYALDKFVKVAGLEIYGPKNINNRSGVISFTLEYAHPHDVAQVLDQEGIAVRSGHHCCMILHQEVLKVPATIRASLYLYNTKDEIDRLINALQKVKQIFK